MLQTDVDVAREDVQLLASRDALAAFFARLGYDTNVRLVQNVNAMGISGESLRASIKHIERLANREALGLLFEVYLFELRSITVAATQAIARSFRDRPGDYLLLLTSDYEELDFVLVQRYIPTKQPETPANAILPAKPAGVSVQPRILTVKRRQPDQVALRVLRRFSYTEEYPFQQYEKLLSAYEVADWSEPFFNNRALFSDYYLTQRLRERSEWNSPAEVTAMTRAFRTLRSLYADAREEFAGQPEQVVRAKLLEPTLAALGFTAQPVKPASNSIITPDYILSSATTPARNIVGPTLAVGLGGGVDQESKPLAVCLAYTWGRNLDGRDDVRDPRAPDENPGAAVVTLLDEGEADWAVVTNGKIWRLYSAKAHSRATNYYEIDLEETLALPEEHLEEAFRYFWLFFRAAAFAPAIAGAEGRQLCFLDSLLNESERYARELGDRLKDRIFERIFPHFARGFIYHARDTGQLGKLEEMSAEERSRALEPYFSGTLTFLYRLLFLLYAESRDLLPVRELHGYYPQSLEKLKGEIAAKAGNIEDAAPEKLHAAYNERSTSFYDRLRELFAAVDKGDAEMNVPVYNGGLFMTRPEAEDGSPEADVARFLAAHKIPDRQLALGLDLMARDVDSKTHALAMIDYKSLGVRQLGSIYEGLLEFKLCVAAEDMAIVRGKKTEEIVPYTEARQKKLPIAKEGHGKEARDRTLPKGAVYLENDRRERKATGSYYTPDYIVKYIVEHTVGPVLREKLETLRPAFREAEKTLRAEQNKYNALQKQGLKGDTPENETYKKHRRQVNDAFFDLKVLDPAMGSGHFLVEAADYITDQMAKFLTAFKWNPIVHELAKTRQEIQEEMERQRVTIDMSKLTDLNLLKRQVLKRCIYGVDLNPMAVELAKVSLWLDCFTLGAPLSFLDHHMKAGNSLIGGSVQEVQEALSQNLWGNQFSYLLDATQLMRRVGELSDVTAQEVAESRKAYKGAYDALAPFKRLLDVWLSEYFGNKGAKHTTRLYADAIVSNDYTKANAADRAAIESALTLAQAKRFFHWELEFPEVFYDAKERKGNGGFDAVVGNPPYRVLIKSQVGDDLLRYYNHLYESAQYNPNLFALMSERAIKVSKLEGIISFIIPSLWLTNDYFSRIRQFIVDNCQILSLVDLGFGVFEEVVETSLFFVKKRPGKEGYKALLAAKVSHSEQISPLPRIATSQEIIENVEPGFSFFSQQSSFKTKLVSLSDILARSFIVYRGVETRDNEKFLTDEMLSPDYKPILMGTDIDRYTCQWTGTYIKFIPRELKSNADIAMYEVAEKVLLRRTGSHLIAGFDDHQLLALKNLYVLIPKGNLTTRFLLSLLNSILLDRYNQAVLGNAGDAFAQLKKTDVEDFPIRRINFTTPDKERAYYLEKAKNLYGDCLEKGDQQCVLEFVEHHLGKVPEEADVVHDLLAWLAEEMMRLNKEKRGRTREFLDWLVASLRIGPDKDGRKGIDALTGKSKLADFAGDYQKGEPPLSFEELWEILLKNKARLSVSLSEAGLAERLRVKYEECLGQALPLKERLAKTDRLIDLVVYRLYGLTEEEIAVVEGR